MMRFVRNMDYVRKYSINKIINRIKKLKFYQKAYGKLFDGKCIREGNFKLYSLINYCNEILPAENKNLDCSIRIYLCKVVGLGEMENSGLVQTLP